MKLKFFILLCIAAVAGRAQTYSISPARTVTFVAPYYNVTINDIYMVNTGSTAITLTWERISVNLPNGWGTSMCDLGTCHSDIPQGPTTMNTVSVQGQGFLGLNIDPSNIAGNGMVRVRVYQQGFINKADTLTWYVISSPTGIKESSADASGIHAFPNPANDKISIQIPFGKMGNVKLKDLSGRTVYEEVMSSGEDMNISNLNSGMYLLVFTSDDKTYTSRIVKK